jgi:hypothetical protein
MMIQRAEHGARLAKVIPGGRLEQIAASYTLLIRDQPERLARLHRNFIVTQQAAAHPQEGVS